MTNRDEKNRQPVPDHAPSRPDPDANHRWTPPPGRDYGDNNKEHITEVSETVPVPTRKQE